MVSGMDEVVRYTYRLRPGAQAVRARAQVFAYRR
jgi:hypothetical protein